MKQQLQKKDEKWKEQICQLEDKRIKEYFEIADVNPAIQTNHFESNENEDSIIKDLLAKFTIRDEPNKSKILNDEISKLSGKDLRLLADLEFEIYQDRFSIDWLHDISFEANSELVIRLDKKDELGIENSLNEKEDTALQPVTGLHGNFWINDNNLFAGKILIFENLKISCYVIHDISVTHFMLFQNSRKTIVKYMM